MVASSAAPPLWATFVILSVRAVNRVKAAAWLAGVRTRISFRVAAHWREAGAGINGITLAHTFALHDPSQERSRRRTPYQGGRFFWGAVGLALALTAGPSVAAAAPALTLDMPAQPLSLTLKRVARAGSVELAFDRAVTDRLRAPQIKGRFTVDQALSTALASSGLAVRRSSDGAYVIQPGPSEPHTSPVGPSDDGAVSELLVMGRRNLNTGIRRTRDDIQPFDVALDAMLRNAGDVDIEAYMRRAMPADAQPASLSQAPVLNAGSARSRIDLLGLGSNQTLVLVDGRRLPSAPSAVGNGAGFVQTDINAIPLSAVERIEVLTAAAGALYGPGATGGVVNVILKRDYRGGEIQLAQGFTEHGDGLTTRLDAAIGRTSEDGRSGLSVRASFAKNEGLEVGERVFGVRALQQIGADFTSGRVSKLYVPVGGAVNVVSAIGPLTLKPAYGGGALGSAFTSFSTNGFTATEAIANAGKLNLNLAPDAFGETQSLLTATRRQSLIVSARHEAGNFEGFFDYLLLDNRGRATIPAGDAVLPVAATSPINPFAQQVYVSRSVPWDGSVRNRSFTQRLNVGLIARLEKGWMVEGDVSRSRSLVQVNDETRGATFDAMTSILSGGGRIGPDLSPFASQEDFVRTYGFYRLPGGDFLELRDRLLSANLRASGPLWRLPGGPMTMTLTAEAFREEAPGGLSSSHDRQTKQQVVVEGNRLALATRSVYGEWRLPLGPVDGPSPFNGLELQVALRVDDYRVSAPQANEGPGQGPVMTTVTSRNLVVARTLGLKTFVADGVMLRASYGEGHLPPRSDQIQPRVIFFDRGLILSPDPRRAGERIGAGGFQLIAIGSPELGPEMARTFSLGMVIEPRWLEGARLSIDYLWTEKRQEIVDPSSGGTGYFLARESLYPSRIVRAPLTDADRARGYDAGIITRIDITPLNIGRSIAETVDVSAEYERDLAGGRAGVYLRGSWQPSYRRRDDPEQGWTETAGYSDGPLRLRAFAGAQWSINDFSIGINGQFYGGYKLAASGFAAPAVNPTPGIAKQDGHIGAQAYFDAFSNWSIGPDGRTQFQLLVRNLLDRQPPSAVNAAAGYSTYGDARGRSFELSLRRRF